MVHWPPTQSHLCSSCFQLSGYCKVICESSAPRQLLAAPADEEGFEGVAIRSNDDSAIPGPIGKQSSQAVAREPSPRVGDVLETGGRVEILCLIQSRQTLCTASHHTWKQAILAASSTRVSWIVLCYEESECNQPFFFLFFFFLPEIHRNGGAANLAHLN